MSGSEPWDCVVVGAGVVGLWTAYHLSKQGLRTLVLEQFQLPHTRGSSAGHSRIMRRAYNLPYYAEMMNECYALWDQLEKDSGKTVFRQTGLILIQGKESGTNLEESRKSMDRHNLPYSDLSSQELASRYPMLKFEGDHALLDHTAGLLMPGRCQNVLQKLFEKNGGTIRDDEKVERIIPGDTITIVTRSGRYDTKRLVLTAGPWAKDLAKSIGLDIPVKTMPGCSVFMKDLTGSPGSYSADEGLPIGYQFLHSAEGKYRFVCFFPSMEYPNMVKLVTRGEPAPYYCHPDDRDSLGNKELVEIVKKFAIEHMPGIDPKPSIIESCMYTMTPDKDFIIDKHPNHPNIVIGAGFSGHGYMRAPIISKLLTEIVLKRSPSYPLEPFKMNRFSKAKL